MIDFDPDYEQLNILMTENASAWSDVQPGHWDWQVIATGTDPGKRIIKAWKVMFDQWAKDNGVAGVWHIRFARHDDGAVDVLISRTPT